MVDRDAEEQLELDDMQGDILVGLQKDAELFVGFVIGDPLRFKRFLSALHLTSAREAKVAEHRIQMYRANGGGKGRLDIRGMNIAFTIDGLRKLGVPDVDNITDEAFKDGLAKRSPDLNDPPRGPGAVENWLIGNGVGELDGLLIITGRGRTEVKAMLFELDMLAGENTWTPFYTEIGKTRPEPFRAHEHFGFLDGVSQPAVRGRIDDFIPQQKFLDPNRSDDPNQGLPGADLHWPGEFVFGYEEQDRTDPEKSIGKKDGGLPWMRNGSFMVFRRLEQLVPEFHQTARMKAKELAMPADLLEARMVGRWPSGAPTRLSPEMDDPALGRDELKNNDFEFGSEDPHGETCPFAAHIRKAYPRNDITPAAQGAEGEAGETASEADTQKRRIMRRGIPFGPELSPSEQKVTYHSRGLMFVSYQTSIVDQFEFITKNWINNRNFAIENAGEDPILGQAKGEDRTRLFTGGPLGSISGQPPCVHLEKDFIRPTGGGYFFMPSLTAIRKVLTK